MLSSKGSGCGPIGSLRHRVDRQSVINAFADFSVRRINNPLIEQRQAREIRRPFAASILRIIPDTVGPVR
jgi:hypothetical protein